MELKIYKARVVMNIVVQGVDIAEAGLAVRKHTSIDGIGSEVEIERVQNIDHLPNGWTGNELAFSVYDYPRYPEYTIKYHLAKGEE